MKEIKSTQIETIEKISKEETKEKLLDAYETIKKILRHYLDMNEDYYSLIAIWILGTYWHNDFSSYPYLYFNAMRGSGKSRALKLITRLSKDGQVMASPTEAVLFRTSGTLGIDEFEGVANKDKTSVRELLNGAYKKDKKILEGPGLGILISDINSNGESLNKPFMFIMNYNNYNPNYKSKWGCRYWQL